MKQILGLLILLGFFYVVKQVFNQYDTIKKGDNTTGNSAAAAAAGPAVLPGMPESFEPSLKDAEAKGPRALKDWLGKYGSYVADPRLAAIQLDYVVMLSRENMGEAKQIFQNIKSRTPPNSPVYDRIKKLDPTFQ